MRHAVMLIGTIAISSSTFAAEPVKYICTLDKAERIIEVSYSGEKVAPCVVNYTKDGTTEKLWGYEITEGQCEVKAAEFAEKQKGWGWSCTQVTSESPAQQ